MQIERPKIELYKVRSFGDKFSAIFEFIRENFKFCCVHVPIYSCHFVWYKVSLWR